MKFKVLVLFLFCLLILNLHNAKSQPIQTNQKAEIQNQKSRMPVLVELFTSETCFSCPPAVLELNNLDQKQPYPKLDIITLAFHVDYSEEKVSFDVFSQPLFMQRQQIYGNLLNEGTIYTPQMIIDGRLAFTGSNKAKIIRDIPKAVDNPKGKLELNLDNDLKLKIKLSELPKHEQSSVFIAIAEDKLVTKVRLGEFAGQNLENNSIVRELKAVGSLTPNEKSFESETQLFLQANWKRENLKIVVFVQENKLRKIHAIGQIKI